ncbi:hypothetical protein E2C01_081559 [Portunus trituberculatus]|uniref:Uncharacterized protein n=1 Tax=Portunus trituberculatus TaxID=210409 RepID=A0A5B7IWN5_PORTR|nr:hypothetical protein [Portunus trituberculatus]
MNMKTCHGTEEVKSIHPPTYTDSPTSISPPIQPLTRPHFLSNHRTVTKGPSTCLLPPSTYPATLNKSSTAH